MPRVTTEWIASAKKGTVLELRPAMLILLPKENLKCAKSSSSFQKYLQSIHKISLFKWPANSNQY